MEKQRMTWRHYLQVYDSDLTHGEKSIVVLLMNRCNTSMGLATPGTQADMARQLSTSVRSIQRWTKGAVKKGFIELIPHTAGDSGGNGYCYYVNPDVVFDHLMVELKQSLAERGVR